MVDAPNVQTLNCPKCAGHLNLYAAEFTKTIACLHCGAILDRSSEEGKLLAVYQQKLSHGPTPIIPLGSRGVLHTEEVSVIGFMVRAVEIEGITYRWREYLLYAGTHGFRWLTEYDGHWNFARLVTDVPVGALTSEATAYPFQYREMSFKHFQSAKAKVDFVLGEFYWQVRVGEEADVKDFVSPPYVLSCEVTHKERTWTLGLYTNPDDIYSAFKLTTAPAVPIGVYSNQPNPHQTILPITRILGIGFFLGAIAIYSLLAGMAQNKTVDAETMQYAAADTEKSRITNIFPLEGHTSNVEIDLSTNLDNNWAYFSMALINLETDEAIDIGKEVSYYHGYDSDGSWSEGKSEESTILPVVPSGNYYLRIEPEEGSAAAMTYTVQVKRDVPRPLYLLITIILLLVPWIYLELANYSFEVSRWSESDHPLVQTGEDDDDS